MRLAYPYTSSGPQMGWVRQSKGQLCYLPTVVLKPSVNRMHIDVMNRRTLTVPMNDTGRLWQCLHPQDSPQVHWRVGVLALRRIPAQDQQVIAKNSDKRTGCHFWGQALYLDSRCIPMGVDHIERDGSLPNNSRQAQGPIHNQTPGNHVNNCTKGTTASAHTGAVVLEGSEIYPGFGLATGQVFCDLPPLACLRSSPWPTKRSL